MKITRVSPVTGKTNTMDLAITNHQLSLWNRGAYIQDIMPGLTADEREFLISGSTAEDWNAMFPLGEEPDEPIPQTACMATVNEHKSSKDFLVSFFDDAKDLPY